MDFCLSAHLPRLFTVREISDYTLYVQRYMYSYNLYLKYRLGRPEFLARLSTVV